MTWKFWIIPFLNGLKRGFLKLSAADGKPGLSVKDFQLTVERIIIIQQTWKGASGGAKAKAVGQWLLQHAGPVIDEYFIPALVARAYDYADKKGILPPSLP
jgi:hypothetical protein